MEDQNLRMKKLTFEATKGSTSTMGATKGATDVRVDGV